MKLRFITSLLLLFIFPLTLFGLTLEEERKWGKEIYTELGRSARMYDDPYAGIYLTTIKDRLEPAANLPFPIKLTLIDSPKLDAFATPGGFVYVTSGLIDMCEKEEELAGVLAHEFGHVGRRHIARRMEKDKYLSIGTVASLVLAMLLQAPALMVTGAAAGQTAALKYSREDEAEADRVGLVTAESVGYSGHGMADFLKRLRATEFEKSIPQYLLTHPYSEARATSIEATLKLQKTTVDTSFFPYLLVRTKVLRKPLNPSLEEIWLTRHKKDPKDPVTAYGAALIYSLKGDMNSALETARGIDSPYRNLFVGELLVTAQRFDEAISVLKGETNPVARFFLAKAYEGHGDFADAAQVLQGLEHYCGTFPDIYQRIGMVLGREGFEAGGYEYLGRYYLAMAREGAARRYLEKAIATYGINSKEGQELLALVDQMKPEPKQQQQPQDRRKPLR